MIERGEEHDGRVDDRLRIVEPPYGNIDRPDERQITERQHKNPGEHVGPAEHVLIIDAIEAPIAAVTVAGGEHETSAHVLDALAVVTAAALDTGR